MKYSKYERPLLTAGGVAAIGVCVLMVTAFLTVTLMRPDYDPLTQAASLLGESGSPYALLFNIAHFLVPGLLLILFAASLCLAVGDHASGKAAAGLVALAGLSVLLSGIFPMSPTSDTQSAIHENLGVPFFLGMPCAALLMGQALADKTGSASLRKFSRTIGFLLIVLVAVYAPLMPTAAVPAGLFQRVYLSAIHVWLVVMGIWLLRFSKAQYQERNQTS